MATVTFIDLAQMLDDAGFPAGTPQANGIAVVCAESGRRTDAVYVNTDGSRDRGLWQINDRWHPEVTDEMAFDAKIATREALRISQGGTDYSPWSTWQNGAYKTHLEAARVALDADARIDRLQSQLASATGQYQQDEQTIAALETVRDDQAKQIADLQAQLVKIGDDLTASQQQAAQAISDLNAANAKIVQLGNALRGAVTDTQTLLTELTAAVQEAA